MTVSDTGVGIPQGSQNKLFQAFSQGELIMPHDQAGAGLGLHIASEIVMLMDGEIAFESTEGQGSRFWVNLPLELTDVPVDQDWLNPKMRLRASVLCEYEPLRVLLQSFLAQAGVDVVSDEQYDLVLIDYTAIRLVQQQVIPAPASKQKPVIACLPGYDPQLIQQLTRSGYHGAVVKTSCPRKFRAELDRVLEGAATSQPLEARRGNARADTPRRRLLVVDDHAVNLKLMQHFGTEIGATVVCDARPSSALQRIDLSRFDLILADLHMPEMSGEELARRIRDSEGPNQHTPIVALTADAYTTEASLLDAGINARLTKPISLNEFRDCVNHWCGTRRSQRTKRNIAAELRQVLTVQLPQDRATLLEHAHRESWEELRFSAHRLHGALLYCDVPTLTQSCAELERSCHSGEATEINTALQKVLSEIDEVLVSSSVT